MNQIVLEFPEPTLRMRNYMGIFVPIKSLRVKYR